RWGSRSFQHALRNGKWNRISASGGVDSCLRSHLGRDPKTKTLGGRLYPHRLHIDRSDGDSWPDRTTTDWRGSNQLRFTRSAIPWLGPVRSARRIYACKLRVSGSTAVLQRDAAGTGSRGSSRAPFRNG